jgi:hypothetical protein
MIKNTNIDHKIKIQTQTSNKNKMIKNYYFI